MIHATGLAGDADCGLATAMIVKPLEQRPVSNDPRLSAGQRAEEQMAFYLHRAFADHPDLLVLNNVRIVDPEQPEHDGRPGVCQIDHLVVSRFGCFIIESKSITGTVTVRGDGAGGDEWTRTWNHGAAGMPSPIQQGRRQAEFLRKLLSRNAAELLGRMPAGTRTLARLIFGHDQRGFRNMPIQLIISISDRGRITRADGWTEPTTPFHTFVTKADLVAEKIRGEFARHVRGAHPLSVRTDNYGMWEMKSEEATVVASFLRERHEPATSATPSPATPPAPVQHAESPPAASNSCKQCQGVNLTALWGKYGYYWRCNDCAANTAMPTVCSACNAHGQRGKHVRIKKTGGEYRRACDACGHTELVWTAPDPA